MMKEKEMLHNKEILELRKFYRKHLLEDIMPFWETRTRDNEYGGYFTCFDREGILTNTDKFIWFQGRQLWMFSALYNQIENDEKWLDLARHGRDFLINYGYAGKGRWNYQLDRRGNVKKGTISVFSDLFVISGLAEYAVASGSDQDIELINEVFETIERNVYNQNFKDIYHNTWDPRYKRHGLYMITLIVAPIVGLVLGRDRTKPLVDHCLEEILYVFAKDEHEALFETVGRDGSYVDDNEGRLIYPGHTMESCWACIEEGHRRNNRSIIDRALTISDWGYKHGFDQDYGGIFSYVDVASKEPKPTDWNKETGMYWNDKNFWVNAEALYLTALVAIERDSKDHFDHFLHQHNWCQEYFFDPEYGEW